MAAETIYTISAGRVHNLEKHGRNVCPSCRKPIKTGDKVVTKTGKRIVHHKKCWERLFY